MPTRPVILANAVALAPIGTAEESEHAIGDTLALTLQATTGYTSFAWRLIGRPADSTATLSDVTGFSSSLTTDEPGEYRVQGVATGNDGTASARVSVIVVRTPNRGLRKVDRAAMAVNVPQQLDDLVEKWNAALDVIDATTLVNGARSVVSRAALRALDVSTLVDRDVVNVGAASTAGDGWAGAFYYDADSADADDGALTLAPNAGSGRFKRIMDGRRINVRWFGATGDGVTDDTVSCVAAVTAMQSGDALYFPAGTYRLAWQSGAVVGNLVFRDLTDITICGDGKSATVIHDVRPATDYDGESYGGAANAGVPSLDGSASGDSSGTISLMGTTARVAVRDLTLRANAVGTEPTTLITRKAVYAPAITGYLHVSRVAFEGFRGEACYAIAPAGGCAVWIDECSTVNCPSNHVNLAGWPVSPHVSRFFVTGCDFGDVYAGSHILLGDAHLHVSGNHFTNSLGIYGDSVVLSNCESFAFTGNTIANFTGAPGTGSALLRIWHTTTSAARCDGLVSGNTIVNNAGAWDGVTGAIWLAAGPVGSVVVRGNVIVGNGRDIGAGPCAGVVIYDAGDYAGTPAATYVVEGNTFGRGDLNQNVGVKVNANASAWDVRIGDNDFADVDTPIKVGATSVALRDLGYTSYAQIAERVMGRAYIAGDSAAFTACKTESFSVTGATPTTVQSYTPPADCKITVRASIDAVQDDGTDGWDGEAKARFLVVAGAVTQIDSTTAVDSGGSAGSGGCAIDIDTSGGAIRVRFTGRALETWLGTVETGISLRTTEA